MAGGRAREQKPERARKEQGGEEGASSPFYSGSGLPLCCQATVGWSIPGYCQGTVGQSIPSCCQGTVEVEFRQNANTECQSSPSARALALRNNGFDGLLGAIFSRLWSHHCLLHLEVEY